jgi:ABC-type taurine transport system substrate-binding protein
MTGVKVKHIVGALLVGLIVLAAVIFALKGDIKSPLISAPFDLSRHPVYSTYRFEKDKGTFHFGIQPLWIFEGNVAELMKRDGILRDKLRELGLVMHFHAFLKGEDVNFFIRSGDLHGGMLGDMPTLTIASNMAVTIPALVDRGFNSIVANRFILVKDLKGMRVAYPSGSFSHHALLVELLSEGLSETQVNLVAMDVSEIPRAFQAGHIDAFAAWEPTVSIALKSRPGAAVIHRSRYLGFVVFARDFSANHPEAVREILAAEIRAIRWMQSDSQHVRQSSEWAIQTGEVFTRERVAMSPEQFSGIIAESGDLNLVPIIAEEDLRENGHLRREFEFLKAVGRIPQTTEWRDVEKQFDRKIIKEVLGHARKYRLNEFDYEIGGRR